MGSPGTKPTEGTRQSLSSFEKKTKQTNKKTEQRYSGFITKKEYDNVFLQKHLFHLTKYVRLYATRQHIACHLPNARGHVDLEIFIESISKSFVIPAFKHVLDRKTMAV